MMVESSFPDLGVYLDTPLSEAAPLLAEAMRSHPGLTDQAWRLVDGRIVRLTRSGTRRELAAASRAMYAVAEAERVAGRPIDGARWERAGGVLLAAAQASDRTAIPTIVRSYAGKAEAVLHLLAEHGRPVPSKTIREHLDTTASNLSHLLTDLTRSGLVERLVSGRETLLALTADGKGWVSANHQPDPVAAANAVVAQEFGRAGMASLRRFDSPLAAMAGGRHR